MCGTICLYKDITKQKEAIFLGMPTIPRASLVAQMVKNLPAMQKTWVQSLGREDPLERTEWQTTPVFLLGIFHGQWSLVGYNPWCCKELDMTEPL